MINLKDVSESLYKISIYIIDIFCGSLIIVSIYYLFSGDIYYSFGERILKLLNYISQDIFKFLIYIAIAWVIGFIVSALISVVPMPSRKGKKGLKLRKLFEFESTATTEESDFTAEEYDLAMKFLNNENYKYRGKQFDSMIRFQTILRSTGSAFFISSLIFLIAFILKLIISDLIKISDLIMTILFISIFMICESEHRKVASYIDGLLRNYSQLQKEENLEEKK